MIGAAKRILGEFKGEIPRTIEELLTVPGAARKTANVVLGTAFGIASGVVVDTHVQRITRRLDLTKETDPVKIEQDLIKILPKERWIKFSHQIILFGRAICVARSPKCGECALNSLCYAADKQGRFMTWRGLSSLQRRESSRRFRATKHDCLHQPARQPAQHVCNRIFIDRSDTRSGSACNRRTLLTVCVRCSPSRSATRTLLSR